MNLLFVIDHIIVNKSTEQGLNLDIKTIDWKLIASAKILTFCEF